MRSASRRALLVSMPLAVLAMACASEGGSSASGTVTGVQTVTLTKDQGLVFATKEVIKGLKFNQVDLYATASGDFLKLSTGGDTLAHNSPVTWFKTAGGVAQSFATLADVPAEMPTEDQTEALPKAEATRGFVIDCYASGGYARGRIVSGDATSVTIEYRWAEANVP